MLALSYAAAYPWAVAGVALIGCGTFDPAARAELERRLRQHTDGGLRARLAALEDRYPDPDARLRARVKLLLPMYCQDPVTLDFEDEVLDARANAETWADMLSLQEAGVYPAAFSAITVPVLMLHGAQDPHPGRLTRSTLERYLPQLEYREWDRCGHYPWVERAVKEEFALVLGAWLEQVGRSSATANVT